MNGNEETEYDIKTKKKRSNEKQTHSQCCALRSNRAARVIIMRTTNEQKNKSTHLNDCNNNNTLARAFRIWWVGVDSSPLAPTLSLCFFVCSTPVRLLAVTRQFNEKRTILIRIRIFHVESLSHNISIETDTHSRSLSARTLPHKQKAANCKVCALCIITIRAVATAAASTAIIISTASYYVRLWCDEKIFRNFLI